MSTDDEDTASSHMWPEIRRISEKLVAIDSKLDMLVASRDDHETRLRKLEERRFPFSSIAAITAVVSMIVAVLGIYLQK